jgi:hypothetical protein
MFSFSGKRESGARRLFSKGRVREKENVPFRPFGGYFFGQVLMPSTEYSGQKLKSPVPSAMSPSIAR